MMSRILFRCAALLVVLVASEDGTCNSEGGPDDAVAPKDCGCSKLNRGSSASAGEAATGAALASGVDTSLPSDGSKKEVLSAAAARHNDEMVEIPPGLLYMGELKDKVYFKGDGEGPVRRVRLSGFRLDKYEVSNAKFLDFVEETGHVTDAERFGDSFVNDLFLSQSVLSTIDKQVAAVPWWLPVKNASWRKPEGVDSALSGSASRFGDRWQHPVIHMSWNDAFAYCRWRNASLPTEAQWEYAARGDEYLKLYPWGDDMYGVPKKHRMNIWQGKFPRNNTAKDGFVKTAPVDAFGAQNKFGVYNMVGNAWEYVQDWWTPLHFLTEETQKTGLIDPQGPTVDELDYISEQGYLKKEGGSYEKVKKGGSFMCHKSYCWRYRICARSKLTPDSSAHHTGFRCASLASDPDAAHWSNAKENQEGSTGGEKQV
eukprot:TRINITY_DN21951_c0_g1_i2.p1 TRINITY_DN21951_c0_g1~~TRINITY_DN21951_c0_g1_i2.p1  ORF type:complete len:428 (-),score=56.74 TRINITY_DN21951_c0_g1_i2:229-1512(-)